MVFLFGSSTVEHIYIRCNEMENVVVSATKSISPAVSVFVGIDDNRLPAGTGSNGFPLIPFFESAPEEC